VLDHGQEQLTQIPYVRQASGADSWQCGEDRRHHRDSPADRGITIVLGMSVARPLRELQRMSRHIASGQYRQRLHVDSRIRELHELAVDMDEMRRALVGVIQDKEAAEAQRQELENRLRHRQRLETVGTLAGGIAHEFNNDCCRSRC
jgi:C4-dicarboxylate-specific signal transduction histidine kinase